MLTKFLKLKFGIVMYICEYSYFGIIAAALVIPCMCAILQKVLGIIISYNLKLTGNLIKQRSEVTF